MMLVETGEGQCLNNISNTSTTIKLLAVSVVEWWSGCYNNDLLLMPHHQDHDPQLWCIFHRIPDSDTQELIQSKISVLRSKRFEPSAAEPHPAMTVYRIVYFYCLYSSSEARSARLPDSKTLIETWSFMMLYLTRSLAINTHLPAKQNVKFFVFNC